MRAKSKSLLLLLALLLSAVLFLCADCLPYRTRYADQPAVAYDPSNRRYLAVYTKYTAEGGDHTSRVYGRLVEAGGGLPANEFVLFETGGDVSCPAVTHDDLNGRFLVTWRTEDDGSNTMSIIEQLVNADGSAYSPAQTMSRGTNYISCPDVAYDGDQKEFLALWLEDAAQQTSVVGQIIPADGPLNGSRFPVSTNAGWLPTVAYDSTNQRFLAAWPTNDLASIQARIVYPDGSVPAPEFSIYSGSGSNNAPTLVYDNVNSRFLLVWEQSGVGPYTLMGEMLNADGTVYHSAFPISTKGVSFFGHALAYDPAAQKYLAVYADNEIGNIYGQVVTAQGALDTTVSNGNLLLSYQNYPGDSEPALAYDSINQRYLASWVYRSENQAFGDIHARIVNPDGTPSGDIFVLSNGGAW